MKALLVFGLIVGVVLGSAAPAHAKDKKDKKADEDSTVWGMLDHNDGCVIFREYTKTKNRFYGVAETSKTFSQLDVIESQNYTPDKKTWVEDQDTLNEMQRIAVKSKLKFVKIPDKYTDKQLEKARAACKETEIPPPPPAQS